MWIKMMGSKLNSMVSKIFSKTQDDTRRLLISHCGILAIKQPFISLNSFSPTFARLLSSSPIERRPSSVLDKTSVKEEKGRNGW